MKMLNGMRSLALMTVTTALLAVPAESAVLSIVPDTLTVGVGDQVVLNLWVNDLAVDEAVGGVSIHLTGDPAILDGVGFVIDPDDKMGVELDFGSGFGPGFLDLVFLAEDFAPNDQFAALKALQGTGFRLAQISLLAIAPGTSPIAFVDEFGGYLSDAFGVSTLSSVTEDGSIQVVPEPALLSLVVVGLAAAARRRQRS